MNTLYRSLLSGLAVLMVSGGVSANDAADVFKKSQEALAKVKFAGYEAKFEGTGWVAKLVPGVGGKVLLGEPGEWDVPRFRSELKLTPNDSKETLSFTVGCDGNTYFLIDPQTKIAHADMDPAVLGTHSRDLQRLLMQPLTAKEPFKDEVKSETAELQGTADIGGVSCDKVYIKSENPPNVIWYIGQKDHLPRKVERIYPNREDPENGEKGTTSLTITGLTVNAKSGADSFKPKVPDGFKETDEFAP